MKRIAIVVLLLPVAALSLGQAQSQKTAFQPGEWQINSVVTLSTGRQTNTQIMVCARQASDFSEHHRTSAQCEAAKITPIPSGYNVKIRCTGGTRQVQWKMQSNINETFSSDGANLQATGSSTTLTTLPGQAPMQTLARIQATGKRTGPCDAKLKPVPATPPSGHQD